MGRACTLAGLSKRASSTTTHEPVPLIHGGVAGLLSDRLRGTAVEEARAMSAKLDVGRRYQSQTRVEEWMTAEKAGNKGVDVLSTPMLVQLIEDAAMHCLAPLIDGSQVSVSTYVDVQHIAPTPVGFILRTEVEIINIDGPRINFAVAAFDEREKVAEGTHERYVMEKTAFLRDLQEKLG